MSFDSNHGTKKIDKHTRISNSKPKSLFLRSIELLENLSCIPNWKEDYYDPVSSKLYTESTHDYTKLLHSLFRQGSMLCTLVNMVSKNTIPPNDIHHLDINSTDPFESKACKENIHKFLTACTEYLFISSDDVFKLQELYKDNTQGFVKAIRLTEVLLRRINSMDIEKRTTSEPKLSIKPYILQESSTSLSTIASERESRVGTFTSSDKSPYNLSIIGDQSELRDLVIKEILDTERSYVNDLELLQAYSNEVDYDKNKQFATIVLVEIFGNINQLVDFQRRFLLEMERILFNSMDVHGLAELFNRRTNQDKPFIVYHTYCSNFPTARQAIVEYKDKLKKYDDIISIDLLPSYIIKPIQRICKYPLLLRELVKHTDKSDADYHLLVKSHQQMRLAADSVNETFRHSENVYLAEDMRKRIEDWKGLRFEHFGKLMLMDKLNVVIKGIEKESIVYLYENYILFCKELSTQLNLSRRRIKSIAIRSYIEISAFINAMNDRNTRAGPTISVSWRDGDTLDSFILKFRNLELMDIWTAAIDMVLSKRNPGYLAALDEHRRKTVLKQSIGSDTELPIHDSSILESAYTKKGLSSLGIIRSRYKRNGSITPNHRDSRLITKQPISESGSSSPIHESTSGSSIATISSNDEYSRNHIRDRQSRLDNVLGLMSPVLEHPSAPLNILELDAQLSYYKNMLDIDEMNTDHLQMLRYYKDHPDMILTNYHYREPSADLTMQSIHLAVLWGYITGLERKYELVEKIRKRDALLKPTKIKIHYRDEIWIIPIPKDTNDIALLDMSSIEQMIFNTWVKYPPRKLMDSESLIDDYDFTIYYRDHDNEDIQIHDSIDWKHVIEDWNSRESLTIIIKLCRNRGGAL